MKQKFKFKYSRGFFSLFSLFIVFMLLAIAGVYMWQKYKSISFPGGDAKDPLVYIGGIRDKITGIQDKQNEKINRAKELAEGTQKFVDKNNLISFEIPQSWTIIFNEGIKANQFSKIIAQSSDFKIHSDNSETIYDGGVQLTVNILRGANNSFQAADGGHGNLFVSKEDTDIDSLKGPLHTYKASANSNQKLLDAHIIYDGNTYFFQFAYNSEILKTGETPFHFKEILASVKFLKK